MLRKTIVAVFILSLVVAATALAVDQSKLEQLPAKIEHGRTLTAFPLSLGYACNLSFIYPVPDGVGDTYEGMRFDVPAGKTFTLGTVDVLLYNRPDSTNDTVNNVVVYVWGDSPSCPPGVPDTTRLLACDTITPAEQLAPGPWPPNGVQSVASDFTSKNLHFYSGQKFHITLMNLPTDPGPFWALLDDGTCTPLAKHWVEWGPGCPPCAGTAFHVVPVCFGASNDLNLAIFADGTVPTLTTYGLIIFGVLLAGTLGWVVVRRRKLATAKGSLA